jgi:hypothetical protein
MSWFEREDSGAQKNKTNPKKHVDGQGATKMPQPKRTYKKFDTQNHMMFSHNLEKIVFSNL